MYKRQVQDVGPGINTSPEIPPTADLVGDELIEFDGNCLECEDGVVAEAGCDCGGAGCDHCGIAGRSLVSENIGSRAASLGKGVARRTVGAGKNILGGVHGQQAEPRLFTPVRNVLGTLNQGLAGNESVHAVGQLSFLSFARDYRGRGRQLSSGAPNLFANGPSEGNFTGVDLSYGRRRSGGRGWEARYIGFDPAQASDVSADPTLVWLSLIHI